MDLPRLTMLEGRCKVLKGEQAQLYEDMLVFCRLSRDPVAQGIRHRLDVIAEAWEALSRDTEKLQLAYDASRRKLP